MRLLALDQSSHTTGWAVFEDSKLLTYGKFDLKNEELGERLYLYRQTIKKIVEEYNIDQVAFEDIQLQEQSDGNYMRNKGVTTYKILAEVFGVTEELLYELKIPYQIVTSQTWKSKLKIKGQKRTEQKQNCQKWVLDTYELKVVQDICDAIAIGASIYIEEKKLAHHSW